jgi:prepilin-type N-terminal cleavage/methylation domain-containing protein
MNTSPNQGSDVCNGQTRAVEGRVREAGSRNRRGFTLIEVVVVVAVLAVLAMLLLPRFTFIRVLSTYANQASSIQDVTQNMLIHHATQAVWPTRFDSLLDTASTGTAPTGLYGYSGNGTTHGLTTGLTNVLTTVTLTSKQKKSLMSLLGITTNGVNSLVLMDHLQSDTVAPGDSGLSARDIAAGGSLMMAKVNYNGGGDTEMALPSDPNEPSARSVYESVFPNGYNPNGDMLVAVGVGPACTAIGKTMISAPQAYLKDGTRYNRTLVLLRVNPNGIAASLAGGLSPDGRTLSQSIGSYRSFAER